MITRKSKVLKSLIRFLVFETAPVEGFIQEVDKQGVMINHNVFLLTDELIILFDRNYNPIRSFKSFDAFAEYTATKQFNRIGTPFTKSKSSIYEYFENALNVGGAA